MKQRKVNPVGCISWHTESVFISGALSGWSVALEPVAAQKWNVWFGRLLVGELDSQCLQFRPLEATADAQPESSHEE
jgi:hypothetical protein